MDIAGCLWSGDAWCENIPWAPTDDFPSQPFSSADGPWIFDLKFSPLWWRESDRHSVESILGILILFWVSLMQYNPLWCFWAEQHKLLGRPLGVDHEGEQLTHSQPFCTHRAPLFFHFQYSIQPTKWDTQDFTIKQGLCSMLLPNSGLAEVFCEHLRQARSSYDVQ